MVEPCHQRLKANFGERVWKAEGITNLPCDLVLVSEASKMFTLERLITIAEAVQSIVVAWISYGCGSGDDASATCSLLNLMWEKTPLMRRG